MQRSLYTTLTISLILSLSFHMGCKHSPIIDTDIDPNDTTGTGGGGNDTMKKDTPCDPDVIYFELQILPIFQGNCAFSGCHDAESAQDGVVLTDYDNIIKTGDVKPFDPSDSEVYEKITEDELDERMPPPPREALTAQQIGLIREWIQQGAKNLKCNPDTMDCNPEEPSFMSDVRPILNTYCIACHSGANPSGMITLNNYSGVKSVVDRERLLGAVKRLPGFEPMPQGGSPLSDCNVSIIEAWVNAGALNN
jgi:hypothetical protein